MMSVDDVTMIRKKKTPAVVMEIVYDGLRNWDFSVQEPSQVSNLPQLGMFDWHLDERTIDYLDSLPQFVPFLLCERRFHLL